MFYYLWRAFDDNILFMDEQIKQIAERLKGLREALELSYEAMAAAAGLSVEEYLKMEEGETDISVSVLHKLSQTCGVELTAIMFGDEPKMNAYFVTRKGRGVAVERSRSYKYQSLAAGFSRRKADPFLVTVHPKDDDEPLTLNSHHGQEFNMVLIGRMLLKIGEKEIVLEVGDSIYFDSNQPHAMKALDGEKVVFVAIIL
jgi:transcriptional regulator with XRE-family HTH domain